MLLVNHWRPHGDAPDRTVNLMPHALRLFESIHQRIKRHNVDGAVDHEVNEYFASESPLFFF